MFVYVCVSSFTFQYVWGMWYIMCRCVCVSLMLLLPTASTILLSFCCILLSFLFCCCCCCFICCLPLERLLLISGWLGLSSAQLCSVQFSSAQPFSPLLSSYFLFIFCRVFFARFHFYLPLSRCVCGCVPTCFWLDTSHTRTYTRIHMRHTHTHTDTRRQAHGHSVGSTHRTARFGRFIYIVYVWYISIPYPLPLPHLAPTLALSAYTMVMCVGVCW